MKNIFYIFCLVLFATNNTAAQDITGTWYGALNIQGTQLRVVFNISKTQNGYTSTMDSPDQGAKDIPVTNTTFANNLLTLEISNAKLTYVANYNNNGLTGTLKQGSQEFPLNMSREKTELKPLKKPQEPEPPFTYYTEDVSFVNKAANVTLSGTLTLPSKQGKYPVVILISGSGPQNRDEELLGHKPFLVLADYLTKKGLGVLRYDDRGIAKSTGDFKASTSADFANDVISAINYLKTRKDIDKKKIGLMGHSEGGLIAPLVASQNKDVNFIVLLAGPGVRGDKLLLLQQALIAKSMGASNADITHDTSFNAGLFNLVLKTNDLTVLKNELTAVYSNALKNDPKIQKPADLTEEEFISQQVNVIATPWMHYFIRYNPEPALKKVKCAVLAVNGEKDLQVPPKENLTAIENTVKKNGNKKVTIKEFEGLNHLFQECKTGSPAEYAAIEQTFSPGAMDYVTNWILLQTKK